ncbi:MAG TPA: DUF4105 domain-containing protein [Chryseolinea sp.]|nr:DUF4105 domain-containing protein [Chryseolinea sp.]
MKKILWLLILIAPIVKAQLSEQANISVLTCGPYDELYSAFGHSAFRIYDPINNINVTCNYGTFDFNQPNFYLNFALGNNLYKLSIQDYQRFEDIYIYENRFIHEQVLNLTPEQKQKLFAYLQWNAKPENASYSYDYFYDNCSTKIRDVLLEALGKDVIFDESHITTNYTIRELTDFYLKKLPWGDLGIDICLGLPMDKKAAPLEYMFLPDYVESAFDHASIVQNGATVPLVKEKHITYEARPSEPTNIIPHPLYLSSFIALVGAGLAVWDFQRRKSSTWFDIILFGTTGLIGILLVLLWFFTSHQAAAMNFNLLWAFPVHFAAAVVMRRSYKWLRRYFLYTTIVIALTLLSWPILPQKLHYALIPLVASIGLRAFTQFYMRNRIPSKYITPQIS